VKDPDDRPVGVEKTAPISLAKLSDQQLVVAFAKLGPRADHW
jgi:hypothetical protein